MPYKRLYMMWVNIVNPQRPQFQQRIDLSFKIKEYFHKLFFLYTKKLQDLASFILIFLDEVKNAFCKILYHVFTLSLLFFLFREIIMFLFILKKDEILSFIILITILIIVNVILVIFYLILFMYDVFN